MAIHEDDCPSSAYADYRSTKKADRRVIQQKLRDVRTRRVAHMRSEAYVRPSKSCCHMCARTMKARTIPRKRNGRLNEQLQLLKDEYATYNTKCIADICEEWVIAKPAPMDFVEEDMHCSSIIYIPDMYDWYAHHVEQLRQKDNDLANSYEAQTADCEWLHCQDRDLRSASRDQQRDRKRKEKYYHYRASKPSMVGKLCYTVTMTKPEKRPLESARHRKQKRKRGNTSVPLEEIEDSTAFKETAKHTGWLGLNTPELLVEAASAADKARQITGDCVPVEGLILQSKSLDQALERFRVDAKEMKSWYPAAYLTSLDHINAQLRLKVRRWTKRDNYENRTSFSNSYYSIRRHHSRKLAYYGKHYNKLTMRYLGRDMKSTSKALESYRYSSGRWHTNYSQDAPWACCTLCECIMNQDPDSTFNTSGLEEYLWEWDEAEIWSWEEEYAWRTGEDLGSPTQYVVDPEFQGKASVSIDSQKDIDVNQTQSTLEHVNHRSSLSSPGSDLSGWVLHSISDAGSDFDLMSDLGEIFSDSEWEEVISIT